MKITCEGRQTISAGGFTKCVNKLWDSSQFPSRHQKWNCPQNPVRYFFLHPSPKNASKNFFCLVIKLNHTKNHFFGVCSRTATPPRPPAAQILISPCRLPDRRNSFESDVTMRPPVAANG